MTSARIPAVPFFVGYVGVTNQDTPTYWFRFATKNFTALLAVSKLIEARTSGWNRIRVSDRRALHRFGHCF